MNKFFLSALALVGSASAALAQDASLKQNPVNNAPSAVIGRACAAEEVYQAQLQADPARGQRMAAIEEQTRRYLAQPAFAQRTSATLVTIPVVFHVVYNTAAQNVTDAQIAAQLKVLNDDFAKLNADASNVPGVFAGVAAATNVRFVMAKRTPTGAPTTGIIRVQTKTRSFSSNDAIKNSSRGGSNAWPAGQYLNFWLGNLSNGLLGYAQFPGGPAATDGVVCLYSSVPGGTATNYNKGRTATHEVGHWLNLRHIWGDATCGNDLVADTPTQQTSNGGCPTFPKITCNNQGDMSMNYMDYTYDACMYMFTAGQSGRMDALFTTGGARASLITSTGGTAPRQALTAKASFYPNPAADVLNLSVPAGANASDYAVRVYDLRGHEMTQVRHNGNGQVQVSALPKGLYYVAISNGTDVTRQRFEKE